MNYPKGNYHRGEDWHGRHKFPGECCGCHKKGEKSDFFTLYTQMGGKNSRRILCRMCPACMTAFTTKLNIQFPTLERG